MTVRQAKSLAKSELISSPTPSLDAQVLLEHITGFDKTRLLLNRDFELSDEMEIRLKDALKKRKTGFPVAYITARKEFFGYNFFVTPDVLIPKPDTELLVELALNAIEEKFRSAPEKILAVCDMCAGSGCVAISIAKTLKENSCARVPEFTLADISEKALLIAKKNAADLLPDFSPRFVRTNLFESIHDSFDIIVTNPPYVPHSQSLELLKDGRGEPLLALDGDVDEKGEFSGSDDGLSLIRRLIPQCHARLSQNGVLIMETGEYNALETAELFKAAGFRNVRIERDINGMMRDIVGIKRAF